MEEKIEIPLSKRKISLLLVAAIGFIFFGVLFIIMPESFTSQICRSPVVIRITGFFGITFFGVISFFLIRKLFDNRVGLKIDQYGITDNTNGTSIGLIEWKDITGVKKIQVTSNKILMLQTNKPEKYIERATNLIAKQAMKANYKMYGSPISILAQSLKISFDELETLILHEFQKRKANK